MKEQVDLLEDVAPASNELGAITEATQRVLNIEKEIEDMIGINASSAPLVSAKTGEGIEHLLDKLVSEIPSPQGDPKASLQALIIDSWFDSYLGVVSLIRIKNGTIKSGQKFQIHSTGQTHIVDDIGIFSPKKISNFFKFMIF